MTEQQGDKMNQETKQLLTDAANEIRDLRRQNERLSIRVNAIDDMLQLLNSTPPKSSQGFSEDIAWKIDKHLKAIP